MGANFQNLKADQKHWADDMRTLMNDDEVFSGSKRQ